MARQGSTTLLAHETEQRAPPSSTRPPYSQDRRCGILENGNLASGRCRCLPEDWEYDGTLAWLSLVNSPSRHADALAQQHRGVCR